MENSTTTNEADRWFTAGRQALVSGSLASVFSTAALAFQGEWKYGSPAAPTNATSHWLWGDEDAYQADEFSLKHTAIGYATHHASAVMWALFYERWLNSKVNPSNGEIVRDALLMTGIAAFVDYGLTPRRFRPGFEARLSIPGLLGVFAAFGAGLALGAIMNRRHERRLEQLRYIPDEPEADAQTQSWMQAPAQPSAEPQIAD